MLLTLGINYTLLSSFHRAGAWLDAARRILAVYGQTPLFFYLAHLYVCATLGSDLFPLGPAPRWLFLLVARRRSNLYPPASATAASQKSRPRVALAHVLGLRQRFRSFSRRPYRAGRQEGDPRRPSLVEPGRVDFPQRCSPSGMCRPPSRERLSNTKP